MCPRTEYVNRDPEVIRVHEHRAPTDASVKLLSEMEQAANRRVIEAIRIGDTTFECVLHMMAHPMDDTTEMVAVFSLNGKKMTVQHREANYRTDRHGMIQALRDKMATDIATTVLLPALKDFR